MSKPTALQMEIAAAWLDANQGEIEEYEACKVVSNWLKDQIANGHIRKLAKENNVPYGKLKSRIKRNMRKHNDGEL